MPSTDAARKWARLVAEDRAGAVAFSRTGNLTTDKFSEAELIVTIGEVDLDALKA